MKITLSSGNPGKVQEIGAYIAAKMPWVSIESLAEAEIPPPPDDFEDGNSIEENGLKKALYAHRPGKWSMSDDSGLSIDVLNGKPGKDAATWAGKKATQVEITAYTLQQLEGKTDRRATFETVITLISPEGTGYAFHGALRGVLLEAQRGTPRLRMPYSALFVPDCDDERRTLAEMPINEENEISHRGQALDGMRRFLENLTRK